MEKQIKIKIPKTKLYIYGKLRGSLKKPLFIIVHGLPGNMDEHFYYAAREWFARRGYATFGFNLYDWHKDARELIHSTLRSHGFDLDVIVSYFRKRGVKKIYVSGHSYGGATILMSPKKAFTAAVLWDPGFGISFTKKRYGFPGGKHVSQIRGYLMRWGVTVIIGEKMAKEADQLDWNSLTKGWKVPVKIIAAGKGVLVRGARQYLKSAQGPKQLVIVPGATHYFNDREGMEERVFSETEKWFKKF